MKVIIALDCGTTGNRAIAFNEQGQVVASSYKEFLLHYPKNGWVEQDANEIWMSTLEVLTNVIKKVGAQNVSSIGITNQRETTVIWDIRTGKPVYNAIVWQDRRTTKRCQNLKNKRLLIKDKTGLFLDPYFSATKIEWILQNVPDAQNDAEHGNLLFGTIDAWILHQLTKGEVHATDPSNASRTMLYNIQENSYDFELLSLFNIPLKMLPLVKPSNSHFGDVHQSFFKTPIPIHAILGDQQASLFAQCGKDSQSLKNTYGTGLFLVASTGQALPKTEKLINTIAWQIDDTITYAVEGSVFIGGSAIQWLRDKLGLIESAESTENIAKTLETNEGVYFVPALTGLGAPYWDPTARGMLIGLTRDTSLRHIVRATLESLAYQTCDVVEEMSKLSHHAFKTLKADGGAANNQFLMQFQSDMLDMDIEVPEITETTALGVAGLAGISVGFWSEAEFRDSIKLKKTYKPNPHFTEKYTYLQEWHKAVSRAENWAQ